MRTTLAILAVLGLAVGGAVYYATHLTAEPVSNFRTVTIERGDLLSTISATGTVEPEEVVDVGAQVVGRIKSLGIDPSDPEKKKTIDYGSVVHEGTVLALIDDSVYKAQLAQAEAALARAEADLIQLQARCDQTEQEWKRAESLLPANAIADTDYDLAVANYKAAKANVTVGKAVVRQNKAALDLAKTNLNYTVIKSPVEGKIIDRRVNIGQTVVASLNAPSLFLIAKDLRKIQVWASVNEADIGQIHLGMPVQFTVDAFPGELFRGRVAQIRLNATMTQNVVTYTVVVATDNADGKLLPYLTANLKFEINELNDVLLVPNMALRWKPRPEQIDPAMRAADESENAADRGSDSQLDAQDDAGQLWIEVDGFVQPLAVKIGPTDGSVTAVSGEDIHEGIEVVIGEGQNNDGGDEVTNPFVPQLRRSKPRSSQ